MNIDNRLQHSFYIIEKALQDNPLPVLSFSGGKDSTVLFHLIYKVAGNSIPLLNINTGIEFPEALEFRDKLVDKYNLTLYEQPAFPETFWSIVDKYGFPVGERRFKGGEATSKCCYYLKKKPLHRAINKFNFNLNITGIRANESHNRAIVRITHGDYYYNKRNKMMHLHPLMDWTDKELQYYIEKEGIELNPIYSKKHPTKSNYKIRTGCWACPQGWNSGKSTWLKTYYPEFYNTLMKKGFAEYIAKTKLGVDEISHSYISSLLEERPCFFDTL